MHDLGILLIILAIVFNAPLLLKRQEPHLLRDFWYVWIPADVVALIGFAMVVKV